MKKLRQKKLFHKKNFNIDFRIQGSALKKSYFVTYLVPTYIIRLIKIRFKQFRLKTIRLLAISIGSIIVFARYKNKNRSYFRHLLSSTSREFFGY